MTRAPGVLDGVAAFAGCPRPVGRRLAAHTDVLRPAPGTVLARAGAVAREVVVVVTGVVELDHGLRLGPGCAFGVDEVLARTPHPSTIVAGDGVELRVVNGPAFLAAAAHLPGLVTPFAQAG